jgi:carboxymethylenebutenolidase
MALREYLRGEVVEDFADGLLSRRAAIHRLAVLGVSTATASSLLAACGGDGASDSPSATGGTTEPDPATTSSSPGPPAAETITFAGTSGEVMGAYAQPSDAPAGAVLVIHENRGLTPHFRNLVGRLASAGYAALAVDLLSAEGGTDASSDEAAAPGALAAAPIERLVGDLQAGISELQRRWPDQKVGVVGFCFGGAMVWNLLDVPETRLAAAIPFYGPAPDDPDFAGAEAAVLAIYAGNDTRVNESRPTAEAALQAAGLEYEIETFDGVDHAFFNDTGPRYDEQAATAAYADVLDWFGRHLA